MLKSKYVPRLEISIKVRCLNGHETILNESAITVNGGGCSGGHGEDRYCYCEYPKAVVEWSCGQCTRKEMYQSVEIS